MRIYIACLAAYNCGALHGQWIDATSDVDAMQDEVAAMLAASPVAGAEEWAIHDYDSFPNLGEFPGLDAVAAMAELFEDFDHIAPDDLHAILANFHTADEARANLSDNFAGTFDSFSEYADNAADEMIEACGLDATRGKFLLNYFNYEAWARDLALEMTVIDCPSGVAVFHA